MNTSFPSSSPSPPQHISIPSNTVDFFIMGIYREKNVQFQITTLQVSNIRALVNYFSNLFVEKLVHCIQSTWARCRKAKKQIWVECSLNIGRTVMAHVLKRFSSHSQKRTSPFISGNVQCFNEYFCAT